MNHQRVYESIIAKAQMENRTKKNGYYEEHHIAPRSEGGSNRRDNLVLLTAKEHYVAHHLLWKIYGTSGLALAFRMMVDINSVNHAKVTNKVVAKEYEKLKIASRASNVQSGFNSLKNGTGLFAMSREQKSELGKSSSQKNMANKVGIFAHTPEQRRKFAKTASDIANQKEKEQAVKNWESSLTAVGLPISYRPTAAESRKYGLRYYFGKICNSHPELGGKRYSKNRKCFICNRNVKNPSGR